MISIIADWQPSAVVKRDWAMSSVRPVTILIATGIVLITGLLIVTGVIAGSLHDQALATTERELARIGAVLAEASSRNFHTADAVLQSVADRLGNREPEATAAAIASPDVGTTLAAGIGPASPLATIALVGRDGARLNTIGWWPPNAADMAEQDFFRSLAGADRQAVAIGSPVEDLRDLTRLIPLARRILDRAGTTHGFLVGAMRATDFQSLFDRVPLGADATIFLVRQDGTVLAQHPDRTSMTRQTPPSGRLRSLLTSGGAATVREAGASGVLHIAAVQPLVGYPVSVVVARSESGALGNWSHQALLFAVFALAGAFAVAAMLYLIARQFRIHAALAAVQAEKIEMERARAIAEAELLKKERLSVLGQLTATVAHELRNPLSAIRNTLFSLKDMASGSELKLERPISRMERSIGRCNRIIGDLLEYARTRELRCAAVRIDHWLGEIVAEQNLPAGVTVIEDHQCGDASFVFDAERLRRVVVNLLENAAQALADMPADGGERRIAVRSRRVDGGVELIIDDTGPGIPPENLQRIFEPLFSTKSFGTGLGLATVKQIVDQHGGSIEVESEIGRGTRFTVRLPLIEEAKVA